MHCSFHVWFKYVMQLRNLHLREEREFLGSLRFRWEHQYRAGNTLAMMIFLIDFLMKHCNVSSRRCHALYLKSQFTIHVLKRNSWLVWPEQWWQDQSFLIGLSISELIQIDCVLVTFPDFGQHILFAGHYLEWYLYTDDNCKQCHLSQEYFPASDWLVYR